jgi:hypothetical protein
MDRLDLDVLDPPTREVLFKGERLVIRPLTIGQLPRLVRAAKPVVDAVLELDGAPSESGLIDLALQLIADHGEALPAAAAIAINKDVGWVAEGDTAEFLELAIAVFEVNRDFFVQRLGPRLQALRAESVAGRPGAGATPSSSSPNGGTH